MAVAGVRQGGPAHGCGRSGLSRGARVPRPQGTPPVSSAAPQTPASARPVGLPASLASPAGPQTREMLGGGVDCTVRAWRGPWPAAARPRQRWGRQGQRSARRCPRPGGRPAGTPPPASQACRPPASGAQAPGRRGAVRRKRARRPEEVSAYARVFFLIPIVRPSEVGSARAAGAQPPRAGRAGRPPCGTPGTGWCDLGGWTPVQPPVEGGPGGGARPGRASRSSGPRAGAPSPPGAQQSRDCRGGCERGCVAGAVALAFLPAAARSAAERALSSGSGLWRAPPSRARLGLRARRPGLASRAWAPT